MNFEIPNPAPNAKFHEESNGDKQKSPTYSCTRVFEIHFSNLNYHVILRGWTFSFRFFLDSFLRILRWASYDSSNLTGRNENVHAVYFLNIS